MEILCVSLFLVQGKNVHPYSLRVNYIDLYFAFKFIWFSMFLTVDSHYVTAELQ